MSPEGSDCRSISHIRESWMSEAIHQGWSLCYSLFVITITMSDCIQHIRSKLSLRIYVTEIVHSAVCTPLEIDGTLRLNPLPILLQNHELVAIASPS